LSEKRYFKLIHEVRVMSVINTNIAANIAANAINKNDREMATAMERLSTGSRINSARDDAAGLAISQRMSTQISGLNQASRNANDAISMLQVAEGATKEISNMLGRMRELAVQAGSGTYTDTDRDALNLEFQALMSEIDRIAKNTEWNGDKILDGDGTFTSDTVKTSKSIQLGTTGSQTMTIEIKSWVTTVQHDEAISAAKGTDANGLDVNGNAVNDGAFGSAILYWGGSDASLDGSAIDIDTADNSAYAITQLDLAINGAAAERAKYGAYMSRLTHASDNLLNTASNTAASRSQIADADYATETMELARTQIISQASTAMLAQANQAKQTVLSLLQG
jgi:flagellin